MIAAADLPQQDFSIDSEIFSAISFCELAKDAAEVERLRWLGAEVTGRRSHVETLLPGKAPIVAATDYVRAYPQLIASYVSARFVALGTDGFGRSDTRAALRSFFEVDRFHIVLASLEALVRGGTLEHTTLLKVISRFGVSADTEAPWKV